MTTIARAALLLAVLVGAIAGVQTPADTAAAAAVAPLQPNIVVIMTDDQPLGRLDAMPKVRSLIKSEGVTYPYSMVPTSLCCPSRTSFLTGRYSHETGVYQNSPPYGGWPLFHDSGAESHTLATWLNASGYETALVGKYLNYLIKSDPGYTPPGWDTFVGLLRGGYYYKYTLRSQINGVTTDTTYGSAPKDYSTDVLAAQAVATIEQAPTTKPLFLVFTPLAPHGPMTPAPRHDGLWPTEGPTTPDVNERYMGDKPAWMQDLGLVSETDLTRKITDQHNSLMAVDEAVQDIVTALGDRAANTLFVFTSDNGLMLGSHRWSGKAMPHAASTLVPLLLRWDGHIAPGSVDERIALNVDVTATILQAAGVDQATSGFSLLDPSARTGTVLEAMKDEDRFRPAYCGWRTKRWLFVQWTDNLGRELYDYRKDPYELHNLADNPAYLERMITMRDNAKDACSPVPPGFTW